MVDSRVAKGKVDKEHREDRHKEDGKEEDKEMDMEAFMGKDREEEEEVDSIVSNPSTVPVFLMDFILEFRIITLKFVSKHIKQQLTKEHLIDFSSKTKSSRLRYYPQMCVRASFVLVTFSFALAFILQ